MKGKKNDWLTNNTKIEIPTLPEEMYDKKYITKNRRFNPWGSPGMAHIYGEGCGANGGNPNGCQGESLDTNPYGTCCSSGISRFLVLGNGLIL